jgi:dienelactone hydrolase
VRQFVASIALLLLLSATNWAQSHIDPRGKLPQTTPWDLKALSKPPKFEWLDEQSSVRSLVYENEPYGGRPTRVFAYYATPGMLAGEAAKDKKLPAVVLIHGGVGTAFREWAELWAKRGYAAIAMDLAGHRPIDGENPHQRENRTRLSDGGPDQGDPEKFGSIDQPVKEQWPYHAVAAVLRAHSLVRSFAEVDPSRTAVTGISWGGYLTCIVAGVDNRFRAAVPVYGCGFLQENSAWLDRFARMTPAQRKRWNTLWDPSQYLPAVSMPILFVNGTNDFAYPLDSYMKSYDVVPGEKQLRITVNMPHSHPAGWAPQEIGWFIDQHLLGAPVLPSVGEPQAERGRIRLGCRGPQQITEAALHWTSDSGSINKRSWTTSKATVADNVVTCEAPPAEATAWFITVTDQRAATVSSSVTFRAAD